MIIRNNLLVKGQANSEVVDTLIPSGTTQTVDWDDGNGQTIDLGSASGDITLTLSNPQSGASYIIKIIQGATARDIVWPASVLWPDAVTPVISTGNDDIDTVSLYYDGTNYLCNIGQNYG